MTRKLTLITLSLLMTSAIVAQTPPPDVQSLVSAENFFASTTIEKGIKKGFLQVSDQNTLVFRPGPVKAREFYSALKEDSTYLHWYPTFARIAQSGDWGFTSGPYVVRPAGGGKEGYGQYLSVWKKNSRGVWKLAMDIGVSHAKPAAEPALDYASPQTAKYFKQRSDNRLQQRKDIVATTDDLMGTAQRVTGSLAYREYASPDFHFLFPGSEPQIGHRQVEEFLSRKNIRINTTHAAVDRAYSGDLAYTYGTAHVTRESKTDIYQYVRIWQLRDGKWYVIFEVFSA